MGGSGGAFGGGYTPDKYRKIVEDAREETRNAQCETAVNERLTDLLSEATRDSETTRERLDGIKEILEEDDIGVVEMLFGGSVKKHTYVDGLSDIDVLVCIDKTDFSNSSPKEVKDFIKKKFLDSNLPGIKSVSTGELAVTVRFKDGNEIQLLPASRTSAGFKIPKRGVDEWSSVVRPDKFAEKLTNVNQQNNNRVVPVIKLVKAIMSQFPANQQLSGYHVESIAIEVFESYPEKEPRTTKAMLEYYFEKGKDVVRSPIKDRTGQSIHVDDDLGKADSPERARISYTMDRISRKMKDADQLGNLEAWDSILGDQ